MQSEPSARPITSTRDVQLLAAEPHVRPWLVVDPAQHDVVREPGGEQINAILLDLERRVVRRANVREKAWRRP